MVKIVGVIADTNGTGISGRLTINLMAPLIDKTVSPNVVRYMKEDVFEIENGLLVSPKQNGVLVANGINVLPSSEPTYRFQFQYSTIETNYFIADGTLWTGATHLHTDNKRYTGAIHTAQSELLAPVDTVTYKDLFSPFNAGIRNVAEIEWADLQHSSINFSNLDTSLYYIKELIMQGSALQTLVEGIYRPRGVWTNGAIYNKGDVVFSQSNLGSYWYINDVPASGKLVTETAYWQELIRNTSVGSGTVDPATIFLDTEISALWNGITNLGVTANAMYDSLINYARLDNAVFSQITAPTKPLGTNTQDVATMQALQQAVANITPPPATTANDLNNLDSQTTNLVNQRSLKKTVYRYFRCTEEKAIGVAGGAGSGNRSFNVIKDNSAFNADGTQLVAVLTGGFVQLRPGTYELKARACSRGTDGTRHDIVNQAGEMLIQGDSVNTGLSGYQLSVIGNTWGHVSGRITLTATTNITVNSSFQTSGDASDRGRPCNRGGNEIYAVIEGRVVT